MIVLSCGILVILCMLAAGHWAMAPVLRLRAEQANAVRASFYLSDIAYLVIYVQIWLAFSTWYFGSLSDTARFSIMGVGTLAPLAIWWAGVKLVEGIQLKLQRHRVVHFFVLIPGVGVTVTSFPFVILFTWFGFDRADVNYGIRFLVLCSYVLLIGGTRWVASFLRKRSLEQTALLDKGKSTTEAELQQEIELMDTLGDP